MNNITDNDWNIKGIDGAIQNDFYIIPLIVLGTLIVFTLIAGVENTFNVLVEFIGGVRAN